MMHFWEKTTVVCWVSMPVNVLMSGTLVTLLLGTEAFLPHLFQLVLNAKDNWENEEDKMI